MSAEKSNTFAKQVQQSVEHSIVSLLAKGDWLNIDYTNRVRVSPDLLQECYQEIDLQRVKAALIQRLEDKLADKIFNNLATEIATDVKSIMSSQELREQCRGILRNHIKQFAKGLCHSQD